MELNKKGCLDAISNIYNSIEEDKGFVTEFSYEPNRAEVRKAGSNSINYIGTGTTTVRMTVEIQI